MKFSQEQLQAINESGHDILVNAGAGSGKTAVLTNRLIRLINNGVKIDELIVLTFTNPAANEMKERLRKELKQTNTPNAKEALQKIDVANIQTFDGFINEFIKKYHYLLNMKQDFTIIDSVISKKVKTEFLDQIFEDLYLAKDANFLELINTYTIDNDDNIKKSLLEMYDKLILNPNYLKILEYIDNEFNLDVINKLLDEYLKIMKTSVNNMTSYLDELALYTANPKLLDKYQEIVQLIDNLNKCNCYDDFYAWKSLSFPDKVRSQKNVDPDEKASFDIVHDKIKNDFTKLNSLLIYPNDTYIKEAYLNTKNSTKAICDILLKLDALLKQYKDLHNVYEFNDLATKAIQILKENDDIREKIKNHTKEILIDEYQDTSDMQEELIKLIANNNVYMVGDIKQSIYGFRNANPNLFKAKFEELKTTGVINFTNNFRSRHNVLDVVNVIFSKLMSENIGGVIYNENHKLNCGFTDYQKFDDNSYDLKIYTYSTKEMKALEDIYKEQEIEAFIICQKIKKMLNTKTIYDKDSQTFRPLMLKDIAIITSTKTNFDTYKKIFEYNGLPLQIIKDEEISNSEEIYAINSLLKLIYFFDKTSENFNDFKYALISFLRSFIYQTSDNAIYEIITSPSIKEALKNKIPSLYEKLKELNQKYLTISLTNLMITIYQEFDVYGKIILLDNVEASEEKLMYLSDLIDKLSALDYQLIDVINFLNLLKEDDSFKYTIKGETTFSNNTIRMLTIHASKGLEYPVCFFPDMYKQFNKNDFKQLMMYTKNYHFILPFIEEFNKTPNIKFILEKNAYEEALVSEELRKLYVAFTRAREQIILVMPEDDKTSELSENAKKEANSFLKLLCLIKDDLTPFITKINLTSLNLSKEYELLIKQKQYIPTFTKKLTFIDTSSKKVAVNEYKASKKVLLPSISEQKLMDIGTKFHKALEISQMDINIIDSLHFSSDIKMHLKAFLNNEFIKSLQIINHYHEYAFSYEKDHNEINGVMDLVLETPDAFYIIDYKLSNIDDVAYQKQLNIYREYLKTITTKPIYTYLYSIYKNEFKKV